MSDIFEDDEDRGLSTIFVYSDANMASDINSGQFLHLKSTIKEEFYTNRLLYQLRTPALEPELALREAEVALRLYGHGGIAVPAGTPPPLLDRLAGLCRQTGATLLIVR